MHAGSHPAVNGTYIIYIYIYIYIMYIYFYSIQYSYLMKTAVLKKSTRKTSIILNRMKSKLNLVIIRKGLVMLL